MSYTPPAGDALAFTFNGSEGYTSPAGDALLFAFGQSSGAEDIGTADAVIVLSASASLVDESLTAAPELSVDVDAAIYDEPLAASPAIAVDASATELVAVDTDFWALCAIELQCAGEIFDEALQAAPQIAVQVSSEIFDEALQAAPQIRVVSRVAFEGNTGNARPQSGLNIDAGTRYGAARKLDTQSSARYRYPPTKRTPNAIVWNRAPGVSADTQAPWEKPLPLQRPVASPWTKPATTPQSEVQAPHGDPPPKDTQRESSWDDSIQPREQVTESRWLHPPAKDRVKGSRWESANRYGNAFEIPPPYVSPEPGTIAFSFEGSEGYSAPASDALAFTFRPPKPQRRAVATDTVGRVSGWVGNPTRRDQGHAAVWGLGGAQTARDPDYDITYPHDPGPETDPDAPPTQPVYWIMPSIEVQRVSDGAEILCNAASASTDQSSWGWSFSLVPARKEDLDLMRPTQGGGPVEISITINGHTWHALVERYSRNREIPQQGWTVQARSPSALFAAPFSAPSSRLETSDRLAQQLAADEVDLVGWTLQWDAVDWVVPGGVYSYEDKTRMGSITRIAQAAGAVVTTAPAAKTIIVQPRYPVPPWQMGSTAAEVILPEAMVRNLGAEFRPGPTFDSVYISGRQQGVLVHAVRDGTGGNKPAQTVVDELITDSAPASERAIVILGESAYREDVDIETYLFPSPEAPGLILPGQVIEVGESGGSWFGLVTGCSVVGTRQNELTVRQRLTIERNFYAP